jgi:REP element-mobilizing transposase RayT
VPFDQEQREEVQRQIGETCRIRGWELLAVNCRSNHVHVVVAVTRNPKIIRDQMKAWCTRRLKELELKLQQSRPRLHFGLLSDAKAQENREQSQTIRENWWAERGSQRIIYDLQGLDAAILYVRECQD